MIWNRLPLGRELWRNFPEISSRSGFSPSSCGTDVEICSSISCVPYNHVKPYIIILHICVSYVYHVHVKKFTTYIQESEEHCLYSLCHIFTEFTSYIHTSEEHRLYSHYHISKPNLSRNVPGQVDLMHTQ